MKTKPTTTGPLLCPVYHYLKLRELKPESSIWYCSVSPLCAWIEICCRSHWTRSNVRLPEERITLG